MRILLSILISLLLLNVDAKAQSNALRVEGFDHPKVEFLRSRISESLGDAVFSPTPLADMAIWSSLAVGTYLSLGKGALIPILGYKAMRIIKKKKRNRLISSQLGLDGIYVSISLR